MWLRPVSSCVRSTLHRTWARPSNMQLKGLVFLPILLLAPLVGSVRQIFRAAQLRSPAANKEEGGPFIERVATSTNAINDVASKGFKDELKLGVLFLNLGGPEKLEVYCKPCVRNFTVIYQRTLWLLQDVEGFLYNLFADPDIIRLPPLLRVFQSPLAYFIAKTRYGTMWVALCKSLAALHYHYLSADPSRGKPMSALVGALLSSNTRRK
jgi:hypothetical protein